MSNGRFELFTSAISQIARSIQKIKMREMAPFGLRGAHVMCLFYLRQSENGLTAAELSELCGIDKGAISRTVAELEAGGYTVCRGLAIGRRYRARITLTESGEQISERIDTAIEAAVDGASEGLSERDRESFDKALMLIAKNLQDLANSEKDRRQEK